MNRAGVSLQATASPSSRPDDRSCRRRKAVRAATIRNRMNRLTLPWCRSPRMGPRLSRTVTMCATGETPARRFDESEDPEEGEQRQSDFEVEHVGRPRRRHEGHRVEDDRHDGRVGIVVRFHGAAGAVETVKNVIVPAREGAAVVEDLDAVLDAHDGEEGEETQDEPGSAGLGEPNRASIQRRNRVHDGASVRTRERRGTPFPRTSRPV